MALFHSRRAGVGLVASSAVLWSTAGLFVRMASVDTWTMVIWRSAFAFLVLGGMAIVQRRGGLLRRLAGFGVPEAVTVAVSVISTISYVIALRLTTVANVMTVYAALPFIAGGIAFAWIGERVTPHFLIAGAVALAGVAVMAAAVTAPRDLLGISAALVMTSGFATHAVSTLTDGGRHECRSPALCGSGRAQYSVVAAV